MNVRPLTPRTSIPTLRAEIIYSLARLKAHPLAAPHAPAFEALRSECDAVFTTENTLRDKLAGAEAAIDMRDEELDDGADRLSAAILAITKNDREHPLYTHALLRRQAREPLQAPRPRRRARGHAGLDPPAHE
jgi:hypothetical protein